MLKYDYVLIDSDDTLLDFGKSMRDSLEKVLRDAGLPCDTGVLDFYHRINDELWRALERGEIDKPTLMRLRFRRLFDAMGVAGDPDRLNEAYFHTLEGCAYRMDGALELCRQLHQMLPFYIVTNGTSKVARSRIALSGIGQYCTDIFISEEVGYPKPDKRYFDYVLEHIGAKDRKRVIILGDSLTSDMAGGKAAGIATCWFCRDLDKPDTTNNYDFRIARLDDFTKLL